MYRLLAYAFVCACSRLSVVSVACFLYDVLFRCARFCQLFLFMCACFVDVLSGDVCFCSFNLSCSFICLLTCVRVCLFLFAFWGFIDCVCCRPCCSLCMCFALLFVSAFS